MEITKNVKYVGVDDKEIDLFEGMYAVPNGMSYNSYVILDEKIAVMDTVDANFKDEWLANIEKVLNGKTPDYLIVQHMEPDHSANIVAFMDAYPNVTLVSSQKAFVMMKNYFGTDFKEKQLVVGDGDTLSLG
jgi:flavorubredoxin